MNLRQVSFGTQTLFRSSVEGHILVQHAIQETECRCAKIHLAVHQRFFAGRTFHESGEHQEIADAGCVPVDRDLRIFHTEPFH